MLTNRHRLALIPKYGRDRDHLLSLHLDAGGAYRHPAEALPSIIRQLGWRLKKGPLPLEQYCVCDPVTKTITLAADLPDRLDYPSSARPVAVSVLAHELGHLRLHLHQNPTKAGKKKWEDEASLYAMVFLLPWDEVRASDHVRILRGNLLAPSRRWAPIYHLAKEFEVTPTLAATALAAYDIVRFDKDNNPYAPAVLGRSAYSLRRKIG